MAFFDHVLWQKAFRAVGGRLGHFSVLNAVVKLRGGLWSSWQTARTAFYNMIPAFLH